VGAWNYSVHPSTEILCIAYCENDQPVKIYTLKNFPKDKFLHFIKNHWLFYAHYAMFENYIWHNVLVKKHGWPAIPLRQWRCTAAKAAAHALPRSLSNAAKALKLPVLKDEDGKRIMQKMAKPRNITKKNKAKWHESPEDFQKLFDYCVNDVEVERAIDKALPDLTEEEQNVWVFDQIINTRGMPVDREAVNAALYLIEKFVEECNNEVEQITNGYLNKVSQRTRVLNWIQTQGVNLPGYTKDDIVKALEKKCPPQVRRVLEIRQQTGKTSTAKYDAFKNALCPDDKVRDMFVYHGASTGRWAGKIVQLHNLPRGNIKDPEFCVEISKLKDLEAFKFFYPNVMGAFSSCIRGMLISSPGKHLFVVDFAAIEARVLAWIAGEEKALEYFRNKEDSYVKMAAVIFETDEVTSDMRFVGKQSVLGCGYGMGAERFKETCASLGQTVSEGLALKAVNAFRKSNPKIVKLWNNIEKAAIDAVRNKVINTVNGISFYKKRDFLYCVLPSGRKLAYHHPLIEKIEKFERTQDQLTFMGVGAQTNYERQNTWGGTLVENIVQAISRDLLTEAMLRVEALGYKVVLHIHDEIVAEVPEEDNNLEKFINLITQLPSWAEGCPIGAEGWIGKRYKK